LKTKAQQMKAKLLTIAAIFIVASACKKDTFETKPKLEFKRVNATTFAQGNTVSFVIEFTDKEGDIDSIYIHRVSKVCPTSGSYRTPGRERMPSEYEQTKNVKAEFAINFAYNVSNAGFPTLTACGIRNDTAFFKFWVKDKAGNISDTVSSPNVVFLKP
jgi:hypothetical protein